MTIFRYDLIFWSIHRAKYSIFLVKKSLKTVLYLELFLTFLQKNFLFYNTVVIILTFQRVNGSVGQSVICESVSCRFKPRSDHKLLSVHFTSVQLACLFCLLVFRSGYWPIHTDGPNNIKKLPRKNIWLALWCFLLRILSV